MDSIFGDFVKDKMGESQEKARIVAIERRLTILENRTYMHGKSFEKINQILKDMAAAINRLFASLKAL